MRKIFWLILLVSSTFLNAQDIIFTKITDGDIVNDGGWNYAMLWTDFDMDGLSDLFVTNNDSDNGKLNFLYLNNGDGTFEKITQGPAVEDGGSSYACSAADVNEDHLSDLFVANYNENNFLYLNTGNGTFEKVTEGPIVSNGGRSAGASWADYNLDGWLDLYVANRDQQNFLYKALDDGSGWEKINSGSIVTNVANSSGCAWGDYDNDMYPDLYVANSGSASFLYHNNQDGTFTAVEDEPFTSDVSSCAGASWGDCDNDGDHDLFVSTGQLGMYENWFYKNNGDGTFTKVTDSPLVNDATWSAGSAWGDYDKDGDLDLAVGGYDGDNLLYNNNGNGNFTKVENNAFVNDGGYTEGLGWADIDNDGDLDIFTAKNNYFGGNNSLFINEGNNNNWLKIRPSGDQLYHNTQAIGAQIRLYAEIDGIPVMQMREVNAQSGGGQGGQNEHLQFFGLGDATVVDSIIATWFTATFKFYQIPANQTFEMDLIISGIHNFDDKNSKAISVYPNPSSGLITIQSYNSDDPIQYISISDINGKQIGNIPTNKHLEFIKFDLRSLKLNKGIYFITIRSLKGTNVKKIVFTD